MKVAARFVHFSFLLGLALSAAGCSFRYQKTGEDAGNAPVESAQLAGVGFAEINAKIIQPKCLNCHTTKKPILTSYEAVVGEMNDIYTEVLVKRTMPKKAVLADNLQALLKGWIQAGMPRDGDDKSTAGAVGFPRPYTFANLRSDVFEPKCNGCHATGNADGLTPLDTYAGVISVKDFIQPLIFGVNGHEPIPEKDMMPPAESSPLTDEEKARVLMWYADGKRDENGAPLPRPRPSRTPRPDPSGQPNPEPSAASPEAR